MKDRDRPTRDTEKEYRRRRSRSKDRGDTKKRSRSHSRDNKKRSSDKDAKKGSSKDAKESKDVKERERSRSRDRKRKSRSRSKDRRRRRSPSKERAARRRSRSKDRRRVERSRSRDRRRRSASRSKSRGRRRRSHSGGRRKRSISRSPIRGRGLSPFQRRGGEDMSTEERDLRTVFCMQLSQRIRARDLEEFFSAVGKVRDVRMIVDNKTRKSKGIAYVEFVDLESVPLAMGLNGQKLFGVPIIVQATQAERNRMANQPGGFTAAAAAAAANGKGPMRLYVGSLHFDITDRMLKEIFEPFGRVDRVELMREDSGKSKGFAFLTFREADAAKKAMEQLNGFEIAGRPIKVNHVTERGTGSLNHHHHHHHNQQQAQLDGSLPSVLDNEELDRTGIELGAHGRLALMAKLAEGTGIQLPDAAKSALQQMTGHSTHSLAAGLGLAGPMQTAQQSQQVMQSAQTEQANPIATQCFLLANMFDPAEQAAKDNGEEDWAAELRDDVLEECRKHGGAVHCLVDKSTGNVYVKCPSIATAAAAVGVLHGRYFAGRVITAAYVPVVNYHQLFPDAINATQLL